MRRGRRSSGRSPSYRRRWRHPRSWRRTRSGVSDPPCDEEGSEDEERKDAKPNTELLNVLTLQYKVANKYEFAAKSAEAYALLYEAATNNVQVQSQRAMKKHKPKGLSPQCHPRHPSAQDHHRRRRPVGRRRGRGRIGGVRGMCVVVGPLRLDTPPPARLGTADVMAAAGGNPPQAECRTSVLIQPLGNEKNSLDPMF